SSRSSRTGRSPSRGRRPPPGETTKGVIMSNRATEQTPMDLLQTFSEFLVGGGVLTMALFPLAIPVIALLIVAALPLVVIGAVLALVGAVIAAPVVLIRGLSRRLAAIRADRAGDRRRRDRPIPGNRTVMGARG